MSAHEKSMKALVQDRYGSADVLRIDEIDLPEIPEGRVMIRVQAAAANPLDWHVMRAKPFFVRTQEGFARPKIRVRGVDAAGTIAEVGEGVTRFESGDRVFGVCAGAFAEFARAREDRLVHIPENVTAEQAAAVPVAGVTALQGLRDHGKLQAGQSVLIIGASGGVGTYAVQLAKHFGAEVTGVCSTRNIELVESLGADHVVDYTQDDFTKAGKKYHLIFQLAGTASPAKLRRVLHKTGTLVLSSGDGRVSGIDRIIRALVSNPFVGPRQVFFIAKETREDLQILADLLADGTIKSVIDRTYPLDRAVEAMRYIEAGHTRGKVIVTI